MTFPHPASLKALTVILGVLGAAIFALDPTVKVAIIVSVAPTIAGIGSIVLGILNRTKLHEIKQDVNSNFSKLQQAKDAQADQLTTSDKKLAHAEGRREGIESTEIKP